MGPVLLSLLVLIVGAFVGTIVMTRVINDLFTESVGRKDWYPFQSPYSKLKEGVGTKGPLVE